MKRVVGNIRVTRLIPLGWTCIGVLELEEDKTQTKFTFSLNGSDKLSCLIRRFCDIEKEIGIAKPGEKPARDTSNGTLAFEDGHYNVDLPRKTKEYALLDNFKMAFHRLQNTDERLRGPLHHARLTAKSYKCIGTRHTSLRSKQKRRIPDMCITHPLSCL